MKISPFPIRIDRLLLSLRWLRWAGHHIGEYPWSHASPDGFAGRERVQQIIKRYDISKSILFTPNREIWSDAIALLDGNPGMFRQEIDLSGLLMHEIRHHRHEAENHIDGFVRFLHAIACGEIVEADLMDPAP